MLPFTLNKQHLRRGKNKKKREPAKAVACVRRVQKGTADSDAVGEDATTEEVHLFFPKIHIHTRGALCMCPARIRGPDNNSGPSQQQSTYLLISRACQRSRFFESESQKREQQQKKTTNERTNNIHVSRITYVPLNMFRNIRINCTLIVNPNVLYINRT